MFGSQSDFLQQRQDLLFNGAAFGKGVNYQRFADDLTDPHAWIERRVRVLENHLHVTTNGCQLAVAHAGDISAVKLNRA
jgi:hypothetical protein